MKESSLLQPSTSFTTRVSSVLDRDVKQFGKQHMFDGQEDTCWNSHQGSPQWICIQFSSLVTPTQLHIQFQGGFTGNDCWVEGASTENEPMVKIQDIFPKDDNSLQVFRLKKTDPITILRIVFNSSSDFFGRITAYKLDIIGTL